ncbi:MAG: AbrB/MazE/SpoVT family DNA-binding domain-containing protein [Betaproteobacteria bacterium]|nr:MAG: AbrB/MazE/SpoVT family DNA-binding domain-containing protein [Betaproteobacteria bacterium]
MLAKLTSKNQITLPKALVSKFPGAEYFAVREVDGEIILKPVRMHSLETVWRKIESLGITEKDVADAVRWARRPSGGVKRPKGGGKRPAK